TKLHETTNQERSLFNRAMADAAAAAVSELSAALLLQIDQVGRIATCIVKQPDFGQAGGRRGRRGRASLNDLVVGDAAQQVVGSRHAVAGDVGRIATEVASSALSRRAALSVAA